MTTLFNECQSCKMKFESSDQLQNHLKKFCQGSDYADLQKLEEKYQSELRNLKQTQGAIKGEDYQQFLARQSDKDKLRLQNENMMSLQDLKEKLKEQDQEFKKLERQDMRKQDDLLDQELNKLKEERMKIRLKKKEDENVLQELLYELEMKKEKEIRARIEKDSIRRALVDLEKAKLSAVGQEKKRELEKLIQEREALRLKEQELVGDIENLESNSKNLDIMRQEELQRMQKVVDGLQFNKKENNKVNEKMVEEKAERMVQLKLRREQLENERARIMNNLEKIKSGDIKGVIGSNNVNLGLATAKNILGDMRDLGNFNVPGMREKVRAEEERLRQMKDDNLGMYKREMMPYDGDEIYGKQNPDGNFPNRVKDYYNNYQGKVNNDPMRLNAFRENVEKIANNHKNDISMYADNKLNELNVIKNDYMKAGGNDPKFIENMNNLQNLYKNAINTQQNEITPTINPGSQALMPFQNSTAPPIMMPGMMNDPFQNYQMINQITNAKPGMFPQGNMNISLASTQPPDSIDMMINMKQQENERIRQQINLLKSGNSNIQNQTRSMVHSSGNLGGQSQSQLPNPFSIFTQNNEFFMHNEVRSVDLDKEERSLINLTQQEVDALRVLSRIPVGTELYRFKMEQYKQISTTRAEIEKIVQEQRLAKLRRKFEQERKYLDRRFDNQRWIDDQRRWILAARIRKEGDQLLPNKDYDSNQGFIVHWDYKLGLPSRTPLSQVVFGIYNRNDTIYQPKLVDPHDTEVESAQTVRCIIGESNQIFDIPADPDTLMIMEVQFPFSKNLADNIGRTDTFGWTQVDLFDFKRQLKRGKFKCPLYYGPTDVNISIPEIKNLEPIPGAWIYFRIAYPNDDEYGKVSSLYPDHTMHEYIIPQIHLRNAYGARQDIIEIEQEPDPIPVPSISYSQPPPQQYQNIPQEDEPEPAPELQLYQPPRASQAQLPPPVEEDLSGGLAVTVVAVLNHVARSHCRVSITLQDTLPIQDENGLQCTFLTSIHNPLNNKIKLNIPPGQVIDNLVQNPHLENMNNKEQGQDIKFQERYKFLRHLLRLQKKNKKDIWLHIKLLELPEPIELQEKELVDTSINYGGLDYQLIGENYFKVVEDGRIKEREQRIKLYSKLPAQVLPNLNYTGAKEMSTKTQVVLNLEKIQFSERDLKKARDALKKKKVTDNDITQFIVDTTLKGRGQKGKENKNSFIENLEPQWNPDAYTKNMGIDIYVDGMRFLPDKVTITKILVDVVNKNFGEMFKQESCLPKEDSTQYMPEYDYRRELRKEEIDRTSMLLFTIITYDTTRKETRRVGYSAVPLFINQFTNKQPEENNEENCCIFEGAYQLPIYCQEFDRTKRPFNVDYLQSLERIPCASLLVRIRKAALSDDGKRSLNKKDFPEKDWIRKGIVDPKPSYSTGVYNTQFIQLTEPEVGLFESRKNRQDQQIISLITLIDRNIKSGGYRQFLDEKLIYTRDVKVIDMMNFAKYDQRVGIKFALDGIHKVPNSKWVYGALVSLNPPGEFYQEGQDIGDSKNVNLVSDVNLLSYAESPQFNSEFMYFRNQPFNRYLSVIVDVKAVQLSKDKQTNTIGWTMVPLFSPDGYVLSGVFQLPLIKGEVNPQLLQQMVKRDPWEIIKELTDNNKSQTKYAEFTSIIVRIVDAQREGHFKNPYQVDLFDFRYLPQPKLKQWAYTNTTTKELQNSRKIYQNFSEFKGIPNVIEMEQFNKGIKFDIASSFGLNQYLDLTN
ncbi:hypothetical protein ABPG74_013562 [Tetrahymena malaccensis]